ncbi:MAG: S8 family peptidase, partial [Candidatus Woesearchaeota archaeon]
MFKEEGKLSALEREKEYFLRYLQRLDSQVKIGELTEKERIFLLNIKTNGATPKEYLSSLDYKIYSIKNKKDKKKNLIKKTTLAASVMIIILGLFYVFTNPSLTGFVTFGNEQEYLLNINHNYTEGKIEYYFNIIDASNNTNNITNIKINGRYLGDFSIKLISESGEAAEEFLIYSSSEDPKKENIVSITGLITGFATSQNNDVISIPNPEENIIEEPVEEPIVEPIDDETLIGDEQPIDELVNESINESLNNTPDNANNSSENTNEQEKTEETLLDACTDTCKLNISPRNLSIIVEVQNGYFYLESIKYSQKIINAPPIQDKTFEDVHGNKSINLSEYFHDPEGKKLYYDFSSNENIEYSVEEDILKINAISESAQEFFIYATDGESVTVSNTFYVQKESKIPQKILDALANKGNVRIIVKTDLDSLTLSAGKGSKNIRIAGLEDVGLQYSDMLGKKVLLTKTDTPLEVKREFEDKKSVIVDLTSLNDLASMPEIEEIILDEEYSSLTLETISLTKISDVQQMNLTGNAINICVLDTGYNGHVIAGYNFVNNNNEYSDINGHGTNVIYPIIDSAPNANLIIAKVIDDSGIGYASDIIAGLDYCAQQNARIISMSIGSGSSTGYCDDDIVAQKINELNNAGILIVAATGNDGSTNSIKIPSCASGALPVGASTKSFSIAEFSNYNDAVLLVAPGEETLTKDISGNDVTISGTSMSVPFVTGTSALLLENELLNSNELKTLLINTGDIIEYDERQFSQLNAWNALTKNYTNNLSSGNISWTYNISNFTNSNNLIFYVQDIFNGSNNTALATYDSRYKDARSGYAVSTLLLDGLGNVKMSGAYNGGFSFEDPSVHLNNSQISQITLIGAAPGYSIPKVRILVQTLSDDDKYYGWELQNIVNGVYTEMSWYQGVQQIRRPDMSYTLNISSLNL